MKCYARTLCLRDDPELIERYKEYHRQVWPEVLAGIREVGILEMRIFLSGTRMFMYCETVDEFDPERDFPRSNASPKAQEWDRLMRTLQARAPEASPTDWWSPMELAFDLNWPRHQPGG
jgi:L-rhamnose mutarotase